MSDLTSLHEVVLRWCDLCKLWYVKCPRCGMNTCSGGRGEDGKCPMCLLAYKFDNKLNESGLSPLIDELLGKEKYDTRMDL